MKTAGLPTHVNAALERLTRLKVYFSAFAGFEDWIVKEIDAGNEQVVNRELRYFSYIYDYIITSYWRQQIFVASSFVEFVIYEAITETTKDLVLAFVDRRIKDYGLTGKSMVIFPLHAFGYSSKNFAVYNRVNAAYVQQADFRAYAQTNNLERTIKNIVEYAEEIKLPNRRKINVELIRHYHRSRQLRWLEANPILIAAFRFSQWPRLDNANVIREQIRFTVTKLYFMKALSEISSELSVSAPIWSTSSVNNWETLDISHFLTIATAKGIADVLSLPVHAYQQLVYEDTNLNITMNLDTKRGNRSISEIFSAIDRIRVGVLEHSLVKRRADIKFARLASSLKYFRRSMRAYNSEDRVINLNSAFEICLLDDYAREKKETLLNRLWLSVKRNRATTKSRLQSSVSALIDERNQVLHGGHNVAAVLDFSYLYHIYARLVLNTASDIDTIDSTQDRYMQRYFDSLQSDRNNVKTKRRRRSICQSCRQPLPPQI